MSTTNSLLNLYSSQDSAILFNAHKDPIKEAIDETNTSESEGEGEEIKSHIVVRAGSSFNIGIKLECGDTLVKVVNECPDYLTISHKRDSPDNVVISLINASNKDFIMPSLEKIFTVKISRKGEQSPIKLWMKYAFWDLVITGVCLSAIYAYSAKK